MVCTLSTALSMGNGGVGTTGTSGNIGQFSGENPGPSSTGGAMAEIAGCCVALDASESGGGVPAFNASSEVRLTSPSNTTLQCPHRTRPSRKKSCSGVTLNAVRHCGHCVTIDMVYVTALSMRRVPASMTHSSSCSRAPMSNH